MLLLPQNKWQATTHDQVCNSLNQCATTLVHDGENECRFSINILEMQDGRKRRSYPVAECLSFVLKDDKQVDKIICELYSFPNGKRTSKKMK